MSAPESAPAILRLVTPDGQVREYNVDFESAIVGRADGNRIVIPDVSVSRRHAHLFLRDGQLYVQDLGSATGTFVDGRRLKGDEPVAFVSGSEVRFGNARASLRDRSQVAPIGPSASAGGAAGSSAGAGPAVRQPGTAPVSSGSTPSAGFAAAAAAGQTAPVVNPGAALAGQAGASQQQWLAVSLSSPPAAIKPGGEAALTLAVHNRGSIVDEVTFAVEGVPPGWAQISRPSVSLLPGARDEVSVVLRVPESPAALAGTQAITIVATSKAYTVQVRAVGQYTIDAVDRLEIAMAPLKSRGEFTVRVTNHGNRPDEVRLEGSDDEGKAKFAFAPVTAVPPGQTVTIPVEVKPGRRRAFGKESETPFRLLVRPGVSGAAPVTLNGTLVQKPSLEAWKRPVLAVLVVAGLSSGSYGAYAMCNRDTGVCADAREAIKRSNDDDKDKDSGRVLAKESPTSERNGGGGDEETPTARAEGSPSAAASMQASPTGTMQPTHTPTPTQTPTETPTPTTEPTDEPTKVVTKVPPQVTFVPTFRVTTRIIVVGTLTPNLEIYEAHEGQTCEEIAKERGITVDEIRKLNEWIDKDCSNLKFNDQLKVPK